MNDGTGNLFGAERLPTVIASHAPTLHSEVHRVSACQALEARIFVVVSTVAS